MEKIWYALMINDVCEKVYDDEHDANDVLEESEMQGYGGWIEEWTQEEYDDYKAQQEKWREEHNGRESWNNAAKALCDGVAVEKLTELGKGWLAKQLLLVITLAALLTMLAGCSANATGSAAPTHWRTWHGVPVAIVGGWPLLDANTLAALELAGVDTRDRVNLRAILIREAK